MDSYKVTVIIYLRFRKQQLRPGAYDKEQDFICFAAADTGGHHMDMALL